jgi:HAD superfamily hydrolase (TIGR01509 family)
MGQEPGTAEEIQQFCSTTYGVTFPLFEKIDVNGDDRHPIYEELTATPDAEGTPGDITWNFEKFLVSGTGEVIGRFRPQVEPEDPAIVDAIEAALPLERPDARRGAVRRLHLRHGRAADRFGDPLARGRDRDLRRSRRAAVARPLPQHQGHVRGGGDRLLVRPVPVGRADPDEVAVTIVDRVIALLLAKGELKPGAEHAIALCARGLSLAVASSSQYRLIDTALDHFGLRHHFALVHSAEDETWGKPHPAVFLTAAAKLGAAPRRCLVWEDAPAGVLAAKAASMACIAVPEHGEEHQPAFALADVVLGSLLEMDARRFDAFCGLPGAAA